MAEPRRDREGPPGQAKTHDRRIVVGDRPRAGRRLFGRYRIERRLGSGGSSEVWLAHDDRLDRTVAIKAPRPELLADPGTRDRFVAEARAAAGLAHPAIVPVYDVVADPASPIMVLRYVDGETLAERLEREGRLDVRPALEIAADLAGALAHAHAAGLVHRDVKPGNVLVDGEGRAQLVDFGIAEALARTSAGRDNGAGSVADVREVRGTLRYMAPEQIRGLPAAEHSDLYSLGLVIYEMLAGHPAFEPADPADLVAAQAAGPPALPAAIPPGISRLVTSLLAVAPAARPADAAEVESRLRSELATLRGSPTPGSVAPTIAPGLPATTAGLALVAERPESAVRAAGALPPTATPDQRRWRGPDEAVTIALPAAVTQAVPTIDTAPVLARAVVAARDRRRARAHDRRRLGIAAAAAGTFVVGGLVLAGGLLGLGGRPAAIDASPAAGAPQVSGPPTSTPPPTAPVQKGPGPGQGHGHGKGHDGGG